MEPLFRSETEYTYEKYTAYCKMIWNHVGNMKQSIIWTDAALVIVCLLMVFMKEYKMAVLFLAAAVIFPVILQFQMNRQMKKAWESNKAAQGVVSKFSFYNEYVEQENPVGASRVKYEELYKIVEGRDAFYLMIANNQGFIIDKAKCSEELQQFIREQKERRKDK